MKISAKKKDLSSALSAVELLAATMAADGKPPVTVDLTTSSKGLVVQFQAGKACVRASVLNAKVEDVGGGGISVVLASLKQVLGANGDAVTLEVPAHGKNVNFTVGKAKGVVALVSSTLEEDLYATQRPKTTVAIPNFAKLVKSTLIRATNPGDRTIHLSAAEKTVSFEATDDYRALLTTVKATDDSVFPGDASITLQSKALNVIADLVKAEGLVLFGFDGQCITVRTPAIFCCLPQQSSPPLTLASDFQTQMADSGAVLGNLRIKASDLKSAYADATAMVDDKDMGKILVDCQQTGGEVIGNSQSGSITSPFQFISGPENPVKWTIASSFLKDIITMYDGEFLLTVYGEAIVVDLAEASSTCLRQTTMAPLMDRAVTGVEKKLSVTKAPEKKAKKEAAPPPPPPAVEETEESPAAEESFDDDEE